MKTGSSTKVPTSIEEKIDIKVLSAWITQESRRAGSQRKFAKRLGITHSTLQKWQDGTVLPSRKSIETIARYKAESTGAVYEWLSNGSANNNHSDHIKETLIAIETAPIEYFPDILEVLTRRLREHFDVKKMHTVVPEGEMACIADFIKQKLTKGGLDPQKESGLRQFASLMDAMSYERLQEIMNGAEPEPWEYGEIAIAICDLLREYPEEQVWDQVTLMEYICPDCPTESQ